MLQAHDLATVTESTLADDLARPSGWYSKPDEWDVVDPDWQVAGTGGQEKRTNTAEHLAALPFTRNAIGSMDFTPGAFPGARRTDAGSSGERSRARPGPWTYPCVSAAGAGWWGR
jgi:hypothetical protein